MAKLGKAGQRRGRSKPAKLAMMLARGWKYWRADSVERFDEPKCADCSWRPHCPWYEKNPARKTCAPYRAAMRDLPRELLAELRLQETPVAVILARRWGWWNWVAEMGQRMLSKGGILKMPRDGSTPCDTKPLLDAVRLAEIHSDTLLTQIRAVGEPMKPEELSFVDTLVAMVKPAALEGDKPKRRRGKPKPAGESGESFADKLLSDVASRKAGEAVSGDNDNAASQPIDVAAVKARAAAMFGTSM